MRNLKKISIGVATISVLLYAVYAYAATVNLGRSVITWPDFGDPAGPAQVQTIHDGVEALSDNANSRFDAFSAIADSTTSTITHNFGVDFSELTVLIYTGSHPNLTRVADPIAAGWIIAAGATPKTQVDVTTPASGGPHTFAVVIIQGSAVEVLDDLDDVDVTTTAPEDGQALVFDSGSSQWIPGASGDSSFKCQSVSDPNVTIKSGFLILDSGVELQIATDLSVSLDTILGSDPADATAYYLYLDLDQVPAASLLANGRQVRAVSAASHFALKTDLPDDVESSRFVPICLIRSANTGTVWSGTGSDFATLAIRRHGRPIVNVSPTVFELSTQSVGSVGAVENEQQALSAGDFPGSAPETSFYELVDLVDDSGNGRNLTNVGSAPFDAAGFRGNSVLRLNGVDQTLTSNDAHFTAPGSGNFSLGAWFFKNNVSENSTSFMALGDSSADRVLQMTIESSNNLRVLVTNTAGAWDFDVDFNRTPQLENRWTHIAIVYDFAATTLTLYVDGQPVRSDSTVTNIRAGSGTTKLRLGTDVSGSQFSQINIQDFFFSKGNALSETEINAIYSRRFTSAQIKAGHLLTADSFPSSIDASRISFWNLNSNSLDGSGNGRDLINNGSTPFTGVNIFGVQGAADLNGTNQSFESTDAFFAPNNGTSGEAGDQTFGAWFKKEWIDGAGEVMMGQWPDAPGTDASIILFREPGGELRITTETGSGQETTGIQQGFPVLGFYDAGWHHIVVRYDADKLEADLFVDGAKVLTHNPTAVNQPPGGSQRFFIGQAESGAFTEATVEQAFFTDTLLADDDIRKLYSSRITHNKNVDAQNQQWFGQFFKGDNSTTQNDLEQDWILDKRNNFLFFDSGLNPEDGLSLRLQNQSFSSTVVPVRTFTTGKLSSDPGVQSHGLGCRPKDFYILHEGASLTGDDDKRYDLCSADEISITCDLSSLTIDSSHRIEIVASCAPIAAVVDLITDANLLITQDQSSGDITVDAGQSFYRANAEIQASHTYTINGIWNTVGAVVGSGTVSGTGTLKSLDNGQNGEPAFFPGDVVIEGTLSGGSPVNIESAVMGDDTASSVGSSEIPSLRFGSSNYRLGFFTDGEAGHIKNKNGDNGIRIDTKNREGALVIDDDLTLTYDTKGRDPLTGLDSFVTYFRKFSGTIGASAVNLNHVNCNAFMDTVAIQSSQPDEFIFRVRMYRDAGSLLHYKADCLTSGAFSCSQSGGSGNEIVTVNMPAGISYTFTYGTGTPTLTVSRVSGSGSGAVALKTECGL